MGLREWLDTGEAPEADWASYVLKLALKGALISGGEGLLMDGVTLAQPHACTPGACTPGRRAPRARSCCADLEVSVTPEEEAAITARLDEVAVELADDPRWRAARPPITEGGALRRPGRRCVFALDAPEGLSCALHRAEDRLGLDRGALKPLPCRLFPLAIIDLGDGRTLLTAVHRRTARHLATRSAAAFPCLSDGQPPLYVSERPTIEALFGKTAWRRLDRALGA